MNNKVVGLYNILAVIIEMITSAKFGNSNPSLAGTILIILALIALILNISALIHSKKNNAAISGAFLGIIASIIFIIIPFIGWILFIISAIMLFVQKSSKN